MNHLTTVVAILGATATGYMALVGVVAVSRRVAFRLVARRRLHRLMPEVEAYLAGINTEETL